MYYSIHYNWCRKVPSKYCKILSWDLCSRLICILLFTTQLQHTTYIIYNTFLLRNHTLGMYKSNFLCWLYNFFNNVYYKFRWSGQWAYICMYYMYTYHLDLWICGRQVVQAWAPVGQITVFHFIVKIDLFLGTSHA